MTVTMLAETFESHRGHLLSVAYRLTGSVTDAEDAVQESWFRLSAAEQDEIRDLRGWLTTVVGRICLDRLKSAAVRRESYIGQWLPEPIVSPLGASHEPDPLEFVVADEANRLAALVVLDTLTPPQRVAFVLHDGFAVPFDEIADILAVSVDSARKLASRARKAVAGMPEPVSPEDHTATVERFLAAVASGDIDAVVAVLHPEAVLMGDANGTTSTAINVVRGPDRIARFFLGLVRKYGYGNLAVYTAANVNGRLGMVRPATPATDEMREMPTRVQAFAVRDGLIVGAYDIANPDKLSGIRLT